MDERALRQHYEMLIAWEIEHFKDSVSRTTLLEIGDIAVGEIKQRVRDPIGYTEADVWDAVDRVIRRRLAIPSFRTWLRRQGSDALLELSSGVVIGAAGGRTLSLDAAATLPGSDALAFSKQIEVVNDQLLAIVARRPELIHSVSPRRFEELIAELLAAEGFHVELTPASKDGGRDILARTTSRLGSGLVLVECKKYNPEKPVGVEVVRALYGTVMHERATAGVVVTTSRFTKGARKFQLGVPYQLSLKDFADLGLWMAEAWPLYGTRPVKPR